MSVARGFCEKKTIKDFDFILKNDETKDETEYLFIRKVGLIPYHAQAFLHSNDKLMYTVKEYYDDEVFGKFNDKADVEVSPDRSRSKSPGSDDLCPFYSIHDIAKCNQENQDRGILYEKHLKKGTPMLHILDVKPLQYGLEGLVRYSWKLDEAGKECNLEIDQSDKNETRKRTVKFSFATNVTDSLLSKVVDGFEVKYMLRTDAIRLSVELEIVLPSPDIMPDFSRVHGEIKLETEHDGKPLFIIDLPSDQPPNKKPKIGHYNNTMIVSFNRVIPRNLPPSLKLTVSLKDSTSTLDVHTFQRVFPYNIPCDQRDYILFKNGHIRFDVCWGCTLRMGKGLCTGVCTCEHFEFSGFSSPVEAWCSSANVE